VTVNASLCERVAHVWDVEHVTRGEDGAKRDES